MLIVAGYLEVSPDDRDAYLIAASQASSLLAFRRTDPGPNATALPDIQGANVVLYEVSAVGPP